MMVTVGIMELLLFRKNRCDMIDRNTAIVTVNDRYMITWY